MRVTSICGYGRLTYACFEWRSPCATHDASVVFEGDRVVGGDEVAYGEWNVYEADEAEGWFVEFLPAIRQAVDEWRASNEGR